MIIKTKVLAVLLGPMGIGLFSLIQNASNLLLSVFPIGTIGFTKYVSEYFEERNIGKVNFLFKKILFHNTPLILLIVFVILCFPEWISKLLLADGNYWNLIILLAICLPLGLISNLLETYLKAIRFLGKYVKLTVINASVSIIVFIPLVYLYDIVGALIATALSYLSNIIICYFILKKRNALPDFKSVDIVESSVVRKIYRMGFAMLIMIVVQQITILVLRTIISGNYGFVNLGIYQSVFSISTNYFGLFFTTMIAYALPKLSSSNSQEFIINEINRILKFFLFIYTPLLMLLFAFRISIIKLLFSDSFVEANDLLFYQLLGELFKAISWVIGLWFIPIATKIKQWFYFEILFNMLYVGISYCLIVFKDFGIRSVPIAYCISYFVFAIVNIMYIKKIIKFKFQFNSLRVLLVSSTAIIFVFLVSQYNQYLGYAILLPVILIWSIVLINKNDIIQTMNLMNDLLRLKK